MGTVVASKVAIAPDHVMSNAFWKLTLFSVTGISEIDGEALFATNAPRLVAGVMLSKA
jgi:hypothetical protein